MQTIMGYRNNLLLDLRLREFSLTQHWSVYFLSMYRWSSDLRSAQRTHLMLNVAKKCILTNEISKYLYFVQILVLTLQLESHAFELLKNRSKA